MLDHQRESTTKIYLGKMRVDEGIADELETLRIERRTAQHLKLVK